VDQLPWIDAQQVVDLALLVTAVAAIGLIVVKAAAWKALLNAITVTFLAGCVSAYSPGSSPDAHFPDAAGDVVTTVELRRLDQGLSVMDALEHVRPMFLRSRGSVSTASIDGAPPTDLSVLQTIRVAEVSGIRLVRGAGRNGPAAVRPDGAVAIADVILVVTRKGRE
jgi:hypothetical protein